MVLREVNFSSMKASNFGHLWKNSNKLYVGLIPTVLLASVEKSINAEFRTPHSSLVNPFIDLIKASETKISKSCFKSES